MLKFFFPNVMRVIVKILVFVLCFSRFFYLDQDVPSYMISGISQEDESYYSIGAVLRYFTDLGLTEPDYNSTVADPVCMYSTPLTYLTFHIFGNNYWGLRLSVTILSLLIIFLLYKSSKIIVGLNIEGSNDEKKISKEDFVKIILGLHSMDNNIIIILLHKPNDRDWISQLIPNEASSYVFPSYPTESLPDLAALIDNLDLIISPDTSIVHMACAFKKPLVAIYNKNMRLFEIWHPISDCN